MSLEMWCLPGLLRSLLWPLLHLASLPILRFGARCWSQRHGHVPRVHGCHQRRRCFGRIDGSWEQLPDGYFVFFLGWYKGASMTMRITAQGCETKNFKLIKSEERVRNSTCFNRTCPVADVFCNSATYFLMSALACSNSAWKGAMGLGVIRNLDWKSLLLVEILHHLLDATQPWTWENPSISTTQLDIF